jgi:bifunctional DNA-binding transcriptional regulator/antitoxin component of YhaV-PrlF toxin-antitoxin module
MVKLQFDTKQYKITLPKAIIEAKGWIKGSEVKIILNEKGELILKNNEG